MQKVLSENFKKASDTYIELKKQAMLTNDPELNKKAQNQNDLCFLFCKWMEFCV